MKIITIKKCLDCPFCQISGVVNRICWKLGIMIEDSDKILSECPLDDRASIHLNDDLCVMTNKKRIESACGVCENEGCLYYDDFF